MNYTSNLKPNESFVKLSNIRCQ